MKKIKNLTSLIISGILCLFVSFSANAQHREMGRAGMGNFGHTTEQPHVDRTVNSYHNNNVSVHRTVVRNNYRAYNRGVYNRYGYRAGYRIYGPHYWSGRGWWGARNGYWFYGGFYTSLYFPSIGFTLGSLPYGYYQFNWNNDPYYYSDGLYYQYDNDEYTVVEPPLGAEISILPSGASPIQINNTQYYELKGVYYQPITKDNGVTSYIIAGKDGRLDQ